MSALKIWRWSREDVLFFMDVLKFVLLLVLVVMFANFNVRLAEQTKATHQVATNVQESSRQRSLEVHTLSDHIDCIVTLFSQPNLDNVHISDIQNCKLASGAGSQNNGSSGGSTSSAPKAQATSPKKPQPAASHSSSSPSGQHSSPPPQSNGGSKPGLVKQIINFLGLRV